MGKLISLEERRMQFEARLREVELEDPADLRLNAAFDRLLNLAEDAWHYRDPDSLRALGEQLQRCAVHTEREWDEPVLVGRAP